MSSQATLDSSQNLVLSEVFGQFRSIRHSLGTDQSETSTTLSCPRINNSAYKAIVLPHDFFVTFGAPHHIALFRFFAIASEVLHASLHSLDSQGRHRCVRTPPSSSSLRPTLATAHLTQRSNDIVLRDLVGTSRLGWSIQPIQTRSGHPTSFSLSPNTAPEFDLDSSTSGRTAQSTLTQHYEPEERKEQTNKQTSY